MIEMDLEGIKAIWPHLMPHVDPITSDKEAEITLHMARVECKTMPVRLRQYSDRWLRERGFGSDMPDEIKPRGWKVRG
jgi:hypothetical protein